MSPEAPPASAPSPLAARLPIVVGVTGHRDAVLAPQDASLHAPRAAIEKELRALLDDFPHTPVLVLSGLAEGIDTLAAEVTLALGEEAAYRDPDGRPRISLVAALPMPLEACALDFRDPGHLAVVERLCARAVATVVTCGSDDVRLDGLDPAARRRRLDGCYARLGAYVSRNCHVLLAVWNGRPKRPGTLGGTADVIEWFEHGAPEGLACLEAPANPLRVPDGLQTQRIVCTRESEPGFLPDARPPQEVLDRKLAADAVFGQLDEFNEDLVRFGAAAERSSDLERSFEGCGDGERRRVGPGRACAGTYLDALGAADALARRFQRRRRATILLLFGVAAAALLCFELYAHGPESVRAHPTWIAGYALGLLGSLLVVALARRGRIEAKYLVYRSFAEALRVQSTWRALGLGDRADDHYSPLHVDAIAWVRHGLKGLHVLGDRAPRAALPPVDAVRWVEEAWIADQIRYFDDRIHWARRRRRLLNGCAAVLLAIGLLLTPIALLAAPDLHGGEPIGVAAHESETRHGLLLIAMVVSIAASGLCRAWIGQMAYEATIDRYESALRVFRRAHDLIRAALMRGDAAAGLEIARALGVEALAENVGWVLLHRDHPLEIRAGG